MREPSVSSAVAGATGTAVAIRSYADCLSDLAISIAVWQTAFTMAMYDRRYVGEAALPEFPSVESGAFFASTLLFMIAGNLLVNVLNVTHVQLERFLTRKFPIGTLWLESVQ